MPIMKRSPMFSLQRVLDPHSVSLRHERELSTSSLQSSASASEDNSNSNSSTFATNAAAADKLPPSSDAQQQPALSPPEPRVTFASTVTIRPIISALDYTPAERLACWYNEPEMKQIKQDRRATLKLMEKSNGNVCAVDDNVEHCYRGLEHKTRQGSRIRQFNQVDAAIAVMDEQELQMSLGVRDADALARVYIACTMHCQASALEKGLRDQMVVLDIQTQPEQDPHVQQHNEQQQPRQPRRLSNAMA